MLIPCIGSTFSTITFGRRTGCVLVIVTVLKVSSLMVDVGFMGLTPENESVVLGPWVKRRFLLYFLEREDVEP